MTDDLPNNPALLPSGLRDLLPPEAEVEAMAVASLMEVFASHGYERVKPPLIEFEDSLFTGSGAAVAEQTFRLMDPDSQRMMGVRADITPQIARIATTRLANAPRPLRLSYFGECLRVRGGQLAPDRQIAQAGIELIGSASSAADAEIVLLGAEALAALGVHHASFDLTLPTLAPALIEHAGIEGLARNGLARALDRKDAVSVARHGGRLAGVLTDLLHAAGPADRALAALQSASLPQAVRILADQAAETIAAIRIRAPGLRLTLDPVEFRGFRYHTGVAVTIYAPGRYKELGRGGRYLCGEAEAATGLTLYPDVILQAAPAPKARPRVFVPAGTEQAAAASLRGQGYATVASLDGEADPESEAARLRCDYIIREGAAVKL
ncbi:MAG: ATP phosphoribosyltransferase regulatory subunit [Acetobacteraceae bacterium]|nr:ATP phosphoribosyltransferase regulatory subunit [Acetobacteraceae bacterium]